MTLVTRALRLLALAVGSLAGAFAVLLISYDSIEVRPYMPQVQAIIHSGPADDMEVPEQVAAAVREVNPHWRARAAQQATENLGVSSSGPALNHVLQQVLWASLLRAHLSDPDYMALYTHMMWFDGGRGLSYGARRYFGKEPHDLSTDEVIGLLAIERSPRHNDPLRYPDRYAEAKARLMERYRAR